MKMKFFEIRMLLIIVLFGISNSLLGQDINLNDKPINEVGDNKFINLNGPRFGVSILTNKIQNPYRPEIENKEGESEINYLPQVISQFGWQFEKRIFSTSNGTAGLIEFVPLIGGLESNVFLPSLTTLAGLRLPDGFEVGFGPNLSLSGFSVVIAMGKSFRMGEIFIPLNFSYSTNVNGGRVSLLVGFNGKNI